MTDKKLRKHYRPPGGPRFEVFEDDRLPPETCYLMKKHLNHVYAYFHSSNFRPSKITLNELYKAVIESGVVFGEPND